MSILEKSLMRNKKTHKKPLPHQRIHADKTEGEIEMNTYDEQFHFYGNLINFLDDTLANQCSRAR